MRFQHNNSKEIDLLHGPLVGKVFAFAIPLMLTNLLQVFYNAADMIVVSHSNVAGAVGSIGSTTPLVNLLLNIFTGLAVGTSVVVARAIGSGNREATKRAVHTSVIASLAAGLICMAVGLCFSRTILSRMGAEGHVLDLASLYTRVLFLGAPFQALANNFNAVLRAKGDTRTPLKVLSFTGLVNVLLNLVFVLVFKMDVDGVALATIAAQALSAVLLCRRLIAETGWVRLEFRALRADRTSLVSIVKEGVPASLQGVLFNLSNIMIVSSVMGVNNVLCPGGSAVIDGNAAANSLEHFIYQACNSCSQAAVTFTSQHYGARMYKRIGKVMQSCYLVTGVTAVFFSAVLLIFRYPLIGLYVSEPLAVETALLRNYIFMFTYYLLAFMDAGSYSLRGLGKSIYSTAISLTGACLLRIVWINTVFRWNPTLTVLYLSYPVSWFVTAAAQLTACLVTRKKLMQRPDAVV
ncbi:MAG: MATE family efflux transporter [Clostridia bacterium]|nr:MATE family efflux transporter [Clostridia bacterium]